MVYNINSAKKSLMNLALSTAIALSPMNSLSADAPKAVKKTAAEISAMYRDLTTELTKDEKIEITKSSEDTYNIVHDFLLNGDQEGAKERVNSMVDKYSTRTKVVQNGVKSEADALFSLIKDQKIYHQKVLGLVKKADSVEKLIDLEALLDQCKNKALDSLDKNEIRNCDKIKPILKDRQLKDSEGRRRLEEVYIQMDQYAPNGNLIDLLNSDSRDNLTESRRMAQDLGSFASKVEEIAKDYKIIDKTINEYVSGWKKASADNIVQIDSLESSEMREIREKTEMATAKIDAEKREANALNEKYGYTGHPFELEFENFSKDSSGQTPASYSGVRLKVDGSFNRTSFGTKTLPSLKDLLYADTSLSIENGSGDIPKIGSISSKNGRDLKMHIGGKFFGENDMFMYAGVGMVTGNEEQNFNFNSGINNAWNKSYNGIGAQIGFQSDKTSVKIESYAKKNSVAQEISRAGIKLIGESSKYDSDEMVLSVARKIIDGVDFKASYRYESMNNPDGKNNVSDIKVGLALNPAVKLIKNKKIKNILKDTRFNVSYENEAGKGYISRGWNFGLSQRFGPVYRNKNNLRK